MHQSEPLFLGIIDHPLEIHHDGRFIADHPGVVAGREERHTSRSAIELAAVIHDDVQLSRHVILEMSRFAAFGGDQWLY